MVPLELTFHCWFVWPLQSQMMTVVPFVVPLPLASRHLFPYTWSCLPDVYVQDWLALLLQSQICTCVPFVVELFGTSTQRLDWLPTRCWPVPGPTELLLGLGLPVWTPAAAITAWAPEGQLPLLTTTLPETTLLRLPLVMLVPLLLLQLLVR